MAHQLLNLNKPITCFAFNKDRSEIAVALADFTAQIYRCTTAGARPTWSKVASLVKHEGRITGIDWAPESDKIVTVSSDRNAFVWDRNGDAWVPELVLLRIPRAATCVKWSPNETKFAAGSSARLVAVCYYEKDQKCWVSKHIKKPIKSTVMCLDWHPEGFLLAAGSSDLTCRVVSAYLKDIESRPSQANAPATMEWGQRLPFSTVVKEFRCNGWVSAVSFNATGSHLAFGTHDSTVNVGNVSSLVTHYGRNLPLSSIMWSSASKLVGVGHDRCPLEFEYSGSGIEFVGKHTGKGAGKTGGVGNALKTFKNLDLRAQSSTSTIDTVHSAPISAMCVEAGENGNIQSFVTSGGEGKVYLWNWSRLSSSLTK